VKLRKSKLRRWDLRILVTPCRPFRHDRFGRDHAAIIARHYSPEAQAKDCSYCGLMAAHLAGSVTLGPWMFPIMDLDPNDFYHSLS
jgi:hypothetical protein